MTTTATKADEERQDREALKLLKAADSCRLVTFKDFRKLMEGRHRTIDDLVDAFRGKIEDPREFFERVMSCRYKGEDRSDVVIPYRSVIEFYRQELGYFEESQKEEQRLAEKRKRGPVSPERRESLRRQLEKVRDMRKTTPGPRENIE